MRIIDIDEIGVTPIDITDLPYDRCLMTYLKEDIDNAPPVNVIPIPDNATNGDMIKAIFSNLEGKEKAFEIEVNVNKNKVGNISVDWWNAPYKVESERVNEN